MWAISTCLAAAPPLAGGRLLGVLSLAPCSSSSSSSCSNSSSGWPVLSAGPLSCARLACPSWLWVAALLLPGSCARRGRGWQLSGACRELLRWAVTAQPSAAQLIFPSVAVWAQCVCASPGSRARRGRGWLLRGFCLGSLRWAAYAQALVALLPWPFAARAQCMSPGSFARQARGLPVLPCLRLLAGVRP